MSLQVEKMEKNMAKLTIEVSAEDLDKAMEGAYKKAKNRISIPGFRKGKAPRKMIEKMYGKGVFLEDAVNALLPEHYSKAAAESELEIVSQPKIDVVQMEPGKDFIFTAEVAVKPEVTLGEWEAIEMLEIFLNTPYDGGFHDGSLDLIKDIENLTMNDKVWNEEPRKISTGPLADAEIFDRSKG